ncbi:MAG: hypothetical protein K8S27_16330, partial [Candidatus Omnitrophica bacterium]|nr:hypothetical protein [Candidatus Omnitrophota bacterium]
INLFFDNLFFLFTLYRMSLVKVLVYSNPFRKVYQDLARERALIIINALHLTVTRRLMASGTSR